MAGGRTGDTARYRLGWPGRAGLMSGGTAQDRGWAGQDGENARGTEAVPALGWPGWGLGGIPGRYRRCAGRVGGLAGVPGQHRRWASRDGGLGGIPERYRRSAGRGTGAVPALCWPPAPPCGVRSRVRGTQALSGSGGTGTGPHKGADGP
ncbi:unnamed protein product [Coccothraustes coccothraustes]